MKKFIPFFSTYLSASGYNCAPLNLTRSDSALTSVRDGDARRANTPETGKAC
jgi:hypothetical protein